MDSAQERSHDQIQPSGISPESGVADVPVNGLEVDEQLLGIQSLITNVAGDKEILLVSEVAAIFAVNPKSVTRWIRDGRLAATKTPGGRNRVQRENLVQAMLESSQETDEQ